MTILIEADELVYAYACSAEKIAYKLVFTKTNTEVDLGVGITRTEIIKRGEAKGFKEDEHYNIVMYKVAEPVSHAIHGLKTKITQLQEINKNIKFYLSPSDGSNFRFKVAKRLPYKGNRFICGKCGRSCSGVFQGDAVVVTCPKHGEGVEYSKSKPTHYEEVRNYLIKHWDATEVTGYEADDALGMYRKEGDILAHIDKDINQVPGKHLNWKTLEEYEVSYDEGIRFFLKQCLTGDKTDNIPGCPKTTKGPKPAIGAAGAEKILSKCNSPKELLEAVIGAYRAVYGDSYLAPLLECADLVGMCGAYSSGTGSTLFRWLCCRYLRRHGAELYDT